MHTFTTGFPPKCSNTVAIRRLGQKDQHFKLDAFYKLTTTTNCSQNFAVICILFYNRFSPKVFQHGGNTSAGTKGSTFGARRLLQVDYNDELQSQLCSNMHDFTTGFPPKCSNTVAIRQLGQKDQHLELDAFYNDELQSELCSNMQSRSLPCSHVDKIHARACTFCDIASPRSRDSRRENKYRDAAIQA